MRKILSQADLRMDIFRPNGMVNSVLIFFITLHKLKVKLQKEFMDVRPELVI